VECCVIARDIVDMHVVVGHGGGLGMASPATGWRIVHGGEFRRVCRRVDVICIVVAV